MASSSLFSLNFTSIPNTSPPTKHPFCFHSHLPSRSLQYSNKKREFPLTSVASIPLTSVASIPYQPINVDYLEEEFSGHGVTFEEIGDSCIAKMRLENGTSATLMLPSGLITSYKAHMWHGGTVELLQTTVSEGEDGNPLIQGGVSLAFNFETDCGTSWSPSTWTVHSIRGSPQEYIQVELISTDAENMVEIRHIMNLAEDTLSSKLIVSNSKSRSIQLMGSLLSHLTVSSPEATYAYGLEGSNIFDRPMFLSNLSIVPPDSEQESTDSFGKLRDIMRLKGSSWGARNQKDFDKRNSSQIESEEEMECEETDNYKHLTGKMSRIYTSAPRDFTIIDRGRRNSVIIARNGFDELYMCSPGSSHESFGRYSFICVGQSAMLKPIVLHPGDVWTGEQHLHNPNL